MLGALTFLPTYLPVRQGRLGRPRPGVRTLPLVVGLLGTSIAGRHHRRPHRPLQDLPDRRLGGHGRRACGCCRGSDAEHALTGSWRVYMLIFGAGIGLCMQVLTIIVQNTVRLPRPRRRDLGGHVLPDAGQLVRRRDLRHDLHQRPEDHAARRARPNRRASIRGRSSRPRSCTPIPRAQIAPIVDAYSHALHVVFLAAVPVAARRRSCWRCSCRSGDAATSLAGATDVGDGFSAPSLTGPGRSARAGDLPDPARSKA